MSSRHVVINYQVTGAERGTGGMGKFLAPLSHASPHTCHTSSLIPPALGSCVETCVCIYISKVKGYNGEGRLKW